MVHTRQSRDIRSMGVSRMYPIPPWNCTQSYITAWATSQAWAFSMATSRTHSIPCASSQAV